MRGFQVSSKISQRPSYEQACNIHCTQMAVKRSKILTKILKHLSSENLCNSKGLRLVSAKEYHLKHVHDYVRNETIS